jgi:hypothetical protein
VQFIESDASTASKFSRHVVMRLEGAGAAWADNLHAGGFVANALDRLALRQPRGPAAAALLQPRHVTDRVPARRLPPPPFAPPAPPWPMPMPDAPSTPPSAAVATVPSLSDAEWLHFLADADELGTDHSQQQKKGCEQPASTLLAVPARPSPHDASHFSIDDFLVWRRDPHAASGKSRTLAVDMAVYTKNRNFRLLGSSKLGKHNPLRLVDHHGTIVDNDLVSFEIFRKSLVTDVPPMPCASHPRLVLFCRRTPFASPFTRALLPPKAERLTDIARGCGGAAIEFDEFACVGGARSNASNGKWHELPPPDAVSLSFRSPFPAIDRFICSQRRLGGALARIRSCLYFASTRLLLYYIADNRYCYNIGRCHRSNHVALLVDMRQCTFCQKCLDPECRAIDFRSPSWPMPPEIFPVDYDDGVTDEMLLEAVHTVARRTSE